MKIVLAIDSYKGCMMSRQVSDIVAKALHGVVPKAQVIVVPVSDGGEGMLEAFMPALGGYLEQIKVHGPEYDTLVPANIGFTIDGQTALIEMAQASGLAWSKNRQVVKATSYGTGELIRYAVCEKKCRRLVIGLGGSACSDGGAGMLVAMGLKLWDAAGNILIGTPEEVPYIAGMDDSCLIKDYANVECLIATDVSNSLYGANGAARVFAPQKGASPSEVDFIDTQLEHWSQLVERSCGLACAKACGAGAAGGVGFALMSYLNCKVESGASCLFRYCSMDSLLADADLVITGEGRSDLQTLMGKLPYQVLCLAQQKQVPVWLLSGSLRNQEELLNAGFDRLIQVSPSNMPLEKAIQPTVAASCLQHAVRKAFIVPDRVCTNLNF